MDKEKINIPFKSWLLVVVFCFIRHRDFETIKKKAQN